MYSYASSSSLSSVFLLTFFVFLDFLGVSSTSSSFPSSAFLFHFFFSAPGSFQASTSFFECSPWHIQKPFLLHGSTLHVLPLKALFHFFPTSGTYFGFSPVSFSISAISSLISSLDIFPKKVYPDMSRLGTA